MWLGAMRGVKAAGQSTSSSSGTSSSVAKSRAKSKLRAKTKKKSTARRKLGRRDSRASRIARTHRIRQAFVASQELEPMAQQLATMRTPEAYAAVGAYARSHTGAAAAAAYLALGHAYLLDRRYGEAQASLARARRADGALADYADFLGAEASHAAGDDAGAEGILHGFTERYPDSIFDAREPELEATVLLALGRNTAARHVLQAAAGTEAASRPGFELAVAQVELALGEQQAAETAYRRLLLDHPLTSEAQTARAKLTELGAESILTTADLQTLAEAYFRAGRYGQAAEQFQVLEREPGLNAQTRNDLAVDEAACRLKLKQLTVAEARALPDTADENGAHRLDLLMELARNQDDSADVKQIIGEMESRFPRSPWLAEALFSAGNMSLLDRDFPSAIQYYSELAARFPSDRHASTAHWRSGWLSYRLGLYPEAERIFDEQIRLYPGASETVAALYWRGRLYETRDRQPSQAVANYLLIVRDYRHYFYAQLARRRLAALGNTQAAAEPQLDHIRPLPEPRLVDAFPADSPHLAKARLVANAGLNEYVGDEIRADPEFAAMGSLAEAQIYSSYGETFRAIRAAKRGLPNAAAAPIESVPLVYWRILFPEPWWQTIEAESARNHLDPYLVASLIRQESEFNPRAISYANAYGLMQLLPSVGRKMAREEGIARFRAFQLLDPSLNLRLGTRYLREMLDRFGGVEEYALAAYNAGDNRVAEWQAAGPYSGIDEFVESIPFTQTREYVEAILRNKETYREIDNFARAHGASEASATR